MSFVDLGPVIHGVNPAPVRGRAASPCPRRGALSRLAPGVSGLAQNEIDVQWRQQTSHSRRF